MHRILQSLLGTIWKPERVCFSHAPPATRVAHVRFFGCPVDFRSDVNGLVFASSSLDARLPKGDPVMARYARQYLDSILEHPHATTTDKDLLGFSGLSALSRWFSGRFDCSASAWRAAHRGRMVPAR